MASQQSILAELEKRGFYQIVFIRQETIVKQRFSLRGSHQSLFDAGDDLRANPFQDEGNDEDVTTQALGERYTVPTGPVTRAQAKRFKEELQSLITNLQDQEIDAAEKEEIKGAQQQRLVHVIQAETSH